MLSQLGKRVGLDSTLRFDSRFFSTTVKRYVNAIQLRAFWLPSSLALLVCNIQPTIESHWFL